MARPNFFIVGAPKCGTSAMTHFLRQHPDVAVGAKENYYFGSDLGFGPDVRPQTEREYLARVRAPADRKRIGECSVFYLHSSRAAREIKEFEPDARIIAMIRNPVDFIHSLHSQLVFVESEDITDFEAALAADADRLAGRRLPRNPVISRSGYRATARFSEQLQRYFDAFGRERVQTIVQDDLQADPVATFASACEFLEVDPQVRPAFETVNGNKRARSRLLQRTIQHPPPLVRAAARALPTQAIRRNVVLTARRLNTSYEPRPPMPDALRRELNEEFAPEVEQLGRLLGRDLSAWSRGERLSAAAPPPG